ncbi:MAG: DNA polymerase IV, partial [Malacoplasma sp.]|nr:DNA polymerase IV [Malacoplasma sp.]
MENKIFHIDMDSFFPSVEALYNPSYLTIPMVVGHRVVSSANYVSRKLGIKSGMPLLEAKKICKNLVVVPPDKNKYSKISYEIEKFLKSLIKNMETGSIDEWYLDVSDSKFENWSEIEFASYIKNNIKTKFNLDCTIGNSFTKFLAKMATNLCKPDGFLTLNKNNFKEYIYDLPVNKIIGIGPSTAKVFKELKINLIKDIVLLKDDYLIRKKIGISWSKIKMNVLGIVCDVVNPHFQSKNISRSQSIRNFSEYLEFLKLIDELVKDINFHLKQKRCTYLSFNLKLRLKNNLIINKFFKFEKFATKVPLDIALRLFEQSISPNYYNEIINVSLIVNNLTESDSNYQQSIFDISSSKKISESDLEKIKKEVNKKFNKKIIDFVSQKQN